jgi:hypothetical protein
MTTRQTILFVVCILIIAGLSVLLIGNWRYKERRYRLIGNILLVTLGPASLLVPPDNLILAFGLGGGLLLGGIAFRVAAERSGEELKGPKHL